MLPSGEKQSYGTVLELLNVTRRDSGLYICEAANGVDNPVSAKIDLKIICKFKSISSIGSGSVIHTFHIFRRTGNPGWQGLDPRWCQRRGGDFVHRACRAPSWGKPRKKAPLGLKYLATYFHTTVHYMLSNDVYRTVGDKCFLLRDSKASKLAIRFFSEGISAVSWKKTCYI